jgi:hypothetical protein
MGALKGRPYEGKGTCRGEGRNKDRARLCEVCHGAD